MVSNPCKSQTNNSYNAERAVEEHTEIAKPEWFRIKAPAYSRTRNSNWGSRASIGGGFKCRYMF